MPAISVGSVEVDVLPNASGIEGRLRAALVPPASQIGDEMGRIIGRQMAQQIAAAVRAGVTEGGRTARPAATRHGDDTAGAFGRAFRTRLQAAMRNLPRADVRLGDTGFNADLARLRARLETLSNKRIGVDVDAAAALAEITRLEADLRRLGANHPDVNVRVDTGQALAELAALQAEVNRLDGQTANVDVDTSSATASLGGLTAAAIAFGPAIIPALPVIAAGLGAIAAAATAAGAGIGGIALVAVPAFKQIGGVLSAQKAAQDAVTQATYSGGAASSQGASKALQLASAQQAVATAERNGARQIQQAQQAVTQARQNAAQVASQAALQAQQAARAVADAEKALATAQKDARQAQLDLTAARAAGAQELKDLNNQLADSVLSQRDAEIQLKEAAAQKNAVLADPRASALDRQKAILQYDQATQRLREQTDQTKQLQKQTDAANKAGIKGTSAYRNAQDALAQAQQQVADKAQALKDAQAAQARTATQNAQQIAAAQQKIADAQANVAVAQQNAADSAASAQRQLQQAQLSTAGGANAAATAQEKYRQALAALTPSARQTFFAFTNLRTAFSAWSRSLQPAVMPIFTRALDGMRGALPKLTPFVYAAADAIKDLQDKAARGFRSAWWTDFVKDLQTSVKPAITGLGVSFGQVFKGIVQVVDAFLPHMGKISDTLQRVTQRFSGWAAGLKGSPEFERFLGYAADKAPMIGDAFKKIVGAFLQVGSALSPLSGPLLKLVSGLAQGVGWLAQHMPGLVQLMYGMYVATKLYAIWQRAANVAMIVYRAGVVLATLLTQGWTAAIVAANLAFEGNPVVAVVTIIVAALVALVAGIIYAWNHWAWFRTVVLAVWSAIKTAALFVWNNVLKPTFAAIWTGLQTIGRWASWLWTNILSPVFGFIATAAKILVTAIVVIAILPIIAAIKILGAIGRWLWTNVFKPVFQAIGDLAVWLWRNAIKPAWDGIQSGAKTMWEVILKPIFRAFMDGLKQIGRWGTWLYRNAIKPAFDGIVDVGRAAWKYGIKPVFDGWKNIIKGLGGVFHDAVGAIKTAWDKIKDVARKPVQFVVDAVYNNGIVGVWNKVASAFGAPKLSKFKFASGGIMPGYTPGRDVHRFVSPTGGQLELSGGEAIMRPEFTKAVGAGFVGSMNSIAKSQGAQGIKAALAPVFGGNPKTPTDTTLRYKDGGIFGWIGSAANKVAGVGSAAWNGIKKGASWLGDTLEASARAGVKNVVNPLLKSFPGMDTGIGKLIRHIPDKIIDALFGYSKDADKKGGGGLGGPKIQAALRWAKAQAGKPYIWGGVGPKGFDCSGFMGAIENVIRGLKPNSRRWATGAFHGRTAPAGWVLNGNSPFRIGITNAGVGHTAGTLGKTNVESRGGQGVVIGSHARGYNNSLFTSWYGFQPGKYDTGGMLQPGMNLAFNGTGRPEPVLTTQQWNLITSAAAKGHDGAQQPVIVELHAKEGELGQFIDVRVLDHQQQLVQVLNAS